MCLLSRYATAGSADRACCGPPGSRSMMLPTVYKAVVHDRDHHRQQGNSAQLTRIFAGDWTCTVMAAVVPAVYRVVPSCSCYRCVDLSCDRDSGTTDYAIELPLMSVFCGDRRRGRGLVGILWGRPQAGQPSRRNSGACPAARIVDAGVAMSEENTGDADAEPTPRSLADKVNWLIDWPEQPWSAVAPASGPSVPTRGPKTGPPTAIHLVSHSSGYPCGQAGNDAP